MGWEPVEELPDERRGGAGAFRGRAEPVVAERGAPSPRERLVLFLRSTPELGYRRSARRLVLTPSHLYVERLDRSRSRVPRAALRGRRLDRGRVVYGIVDGEDLALLPRPGCEVVEAIEAQLRGDEAPLRAIEIRRYQTASVMAAGGFFSLGLALLDGGWLDSALSAIRAGLVTAEPATSLYIVAGCGFAGLFILLFGPVRIRIDVIGVHVVRGIVPFMHTIVAPEALRVLVVRFSKHLSTYRGPARWSVRLARVRGRGHILLETFKPPSQSTQHDAMQLAEQVGARLEREVEVIE